LVEDSDVKRVTNGKVDDIDTLNLIKVTLFRQKEAKGSVRNEPTFFIAPPFAICNGAHDFIFKNIFLSSTNILKA